jgi:hypothetical protein
LEDAKVIVSGGRGLGNPKGFELIKKVADKFSGVCRRIPRHGGVAAGYPATIR